MPRKRYKPKLKARGPIGPARDAALAELRARLKAFSKRARGMGYPARYMTHKNADGTIDGECLITIPEDDTLSNVMLQLGQYVPSFQAPGYSFSTEIEDESPPVIPDDSGEPSRYKYIRDKAHIQTGYNSDPNLAWVAMYGSVAPNILDFEANTLKLRVFWHPKGELRSKQWKG